MNLVTRRKYLVDNAGYDDVKDWVANPGTERVLDAEFRATGDEYVRAVVEAGRKSPALLIWDVMNDPTNTRVDPSNVDSNKGFVSNRYEPYPDLLKMMR